MKKDTGKEKIGIIGGTGLENIACIRINVTNIDVINILIFIPIY